MVLCKRKHLEWNSSLHVEEVPEVQYRVQDLIFWSLPCRGADSFSLYGDSTYLGDYSWIDMKSYSFKLTDTEKRLAEEARLMEK